MWKLQCYTLSWPGPMNLDAVKKYSRREKFTFIGLGAECILNHPDFSPLTNCTVLEQVGPLLHDKDRRHYRRRNGGAQNK